MVKIIPIPADVIAVLDTMLYDIPHPAARHNTLDDFNMWTRPPKADVSHAGTDFGGGDLGQFLSSEHEGPLLDAVGGERMTNAVLYPAGAIMSWHTNSNFPGTRRYYTWSEKGGAVFRYIDPTTGKRHDSIDPPGWVCREFEVTVDPPLWHTIWTPAPRWAYGVMMKDTR